MHSNYESLKYNSHQHQQLMNHEQESQEIASMAASTAIETLKRLAKRVSSDSKYFFPSYC